MIELEQWPWLAERARRSPDRPALLWRAFPSRAAPHSGVATEAFALTYRELEARVQAALRKLEQEAVEPGQVVAVLLPNGVALVEWLHALWARGAVVLPLNLRLTPAELAFQLSDSGARWLLHGSDSLAEQARAATEELPELGQIELSPKSAGQGVVLRVKRPSDPSPAGLSSGKSSENTGPASSPDLGAAVAILYTSGTTGRPKGALLTARNFFASAEASAVRLGSAPGDRWLACLPLYHIGGLSILVRSVIRGSSVVVHERFDPAQVDRALDDDEVTAVSLVPAMLARLLDHRKGRASPAPLRCVLVGGGPISESLLERASEVGFPVATTYGLTEACSQVATRPPTQLGAPHGGGLRALAGVDLKIVEEWERQARSVGGASRSAPAEVDRVGEICLRGAIVFEGYLRRPRETALALREGWLYTGDIGRLDSEGRLEVLDRRCDLIVSGGENVYPAEVEAVLLQHPSISDAAVVGQSDVDFGARPTAWIVVSGKSAPSSAELSDFCRQRLAAYKVPLAFRPVSELPRNAAGKLLRRMLRPELPHPSSTR